MLLRTLLMGMIFTTVIGCSDSSDDKSPPVLDVGTAPSAPAAFPPQQQQQQQNGVTNNNRPALIPNNVLVKGNPLELIKGAKLNQQLPKLDKLKQLFMRSKLVKTVNFASSIDLTPIDITSTPQQLNSPQTMDISKLQNLKNYQVLERIVQKKETQDIYEVLITPLSGANGLPKIIMKREVTQKNQNEYEESLKVVGVGINIDKRYPAELVHFSLKEDGSAASFLVFTKTPQRSFLSNIVFTFKEEGVDTSVPFIADAPTNYNYLFGPGVRVTWPNKNKLKLDFCYDYDHTEVVLAFAVKNSKQDWNEKTEVQIAQRYKRKNYPPFSDLNSSCIYVVENYSNTPNGQKVANPASSMTVANLDQKTIIDGDIIIWKNEVAKYYGPKVAELAGKGKTKDEINEVIEKSIRRAITHEIGHFIGLDHKFEEGVETIMSYEKDHTEISEYDIQAVQELYL